MATPDVLDNGRQHRATRAISATTAALGSFPAILVSVLLIVVWAATGPLFHFSDTWQLLINTFTTLVTFVMVFIIQNTQNRDGRALQLKLDEIVRVLGSARNDLVGIEEQPEREIRRWQDEEHLLARFAHPSGSALEPVSSSADNGVRG